MAKAALLGPPAMAPVRGALAIARRGGLPQTTEPHPRNSPASWAMGVWALLVWGAWGTHAAQAQATVITAPLDPATQTRAATPSLLLETETETKAETMPVGVPAKRLQYALGLRVKTQTSPGASTGLVLRPVLGLRYGRWRLGHATGDRWLQFSGYRKDTNLSYQLRDNDRFSVALSMRVQNLKDNTSFDGFSDGQNTLRGRVGVNYRLNQRWSIGSDVTQDLLGRGDGTTWSFGTGYGLPLNARSALSLSGGLSWASASHWSTQMRLFDAPSEGWQSGIGSVGVGAAYRYAISPQWAWFGTLSAARPLGQVQAVSPKPLRWNGQVGFLYFSP